MANSAVPPVGNRKIDKLNIPGHIKLTAKPVSAQAARETKGMLTRAVTM